MQETLIIYLHQADLSQPGWAVLDTDHRVRRSVYRDQADGLATLAEGKEIIVIVPAEDVLTTLVALPPMPKNRLLQALPFALEDQVVDEVETLHFAVGATETNGEWPVAIVAQEKIQAWMTLLASWNIKPDRLISAIAGLPIALHAWQIALHQDIAIVRTNAWQGFVCDINNIESVLALAITESIEKPQEILLRDYRDHATPLVFALPIPVTQKICSMDDWMTDVAIQVANTPNVNLLQGDFVAKRSRMPHLNKLGKVAMYLGIAWVALLFIYPLGSYIMLSQRVGYIESQINQIYLRQFPHSTQIIAPRLRMEEKLQKMMGQIGENKILRLLGIVGKGLASSPNVILKRYDFQNNQLTLTLNAASSDDFSKFADFLSQQGLQVKQQNAALSGERVNATLQVE